jgi:hypothetical protein
MTDQPVYIYAFCDAAHADSSLEGLEGRPVRFVECKGVFAAVSDAPDGRIRPQRKLLASHQRVLSSLAESIPTLPAAFGLVADSVSQLEAAVRDNTESLQTELERVGRCVEFDLRLAWEVENVFEHLVSLDDELAALRDELVSMGEQAPHDLRVRIGRRVERVLAAHREGASAAVIDTIAPACREIDATEPTSEAELVRLAVLVGRDDAERYEELVGIAAGRFDDTHVFKLAGPFAPHSFVDLHLDLSNSRMAS